MTLKPDATSAGQKIKVTVVPASPVAFDRERTLDKVHALTDKAVRMGALERNGG